jgi:hypothetical protein
MFYESKRKLSPIIIIYNHKKKSAFCIVNNFGSTGLKPGSFEATVLKYFTTTTTTTITATTNNNSKPLFCSVVKYLCSYKSSGLATQAVPLSEFQTCIFRV